MSLRAPRGNRLPSHHKSLSGPGDTVLVACAGSGADAAAALKMGRNVVVFEKDRRQYNHIVERLRAIGTKLEADQTVDIDEGVVVNHEMFAAQARVGFQPVFKGHDDHVKWIVSKSSTDELESAISKLQGALSDRRDREEEVKEAAKNKKNTDGKGEAGEDKEEQEVEPDAAEEEEAAMLMKNASVECAKCSIDDINITPCNVCDQRVCAQCLVTEEGKKEVFCSEGCKSAYYEDLKAKPSTQSQEF